MQTKFRTNPFSRQALKKDDLLSGKKHLECLKNIRRTLNFSNYQNNCKSIIIRGDRGTGKTSLLKIIQADSKKYNLIPIPLYLTETNSNSTINFLQSLYNSAFNVCKENEILLEEINNAEVSVLKSEISERTDLWVFEFINKLIQNKISSNTESNIQAEDILNDLNLILQQHRRDKIKFSENAKLAFFIDESQLIFSNKEILNIIRFLIQEEIGVVFILASHHPCEDEILSIVFDSVERSFQIYNIGYFDTIADIEQFLKKSLESVGWKEKDLKTCINNFEKLTVNIFKLTGGKPEFVNRIADEMFTKVMIGGDTKMRWNNSLLSKIADDLEMQVGNLNSKNAFTFNKRRAESIIKLDNDDFKWFRYLAASNMSATPRDVYETLRYLIDSKYDNIDNFRNFIIHLQKNNLLAFESFSNEINSNSIGFNTNQNIDIDILDRKYLYLGTDSEKYWLLIMLQTNSNRVIKFISRSPIKTLNEDIANIAGYSGQAMVSLKSEESYVFSTRGFVEGSYQDFNYKDFFEAIKNNEINIDNINGELLLFLFDLLKEIPNSVSFFSYSIKIQNLKFNCYTYKFELSELIPFEERLNQLQERFKEDGIEFHFKYEQINKSELISPDEFSDLIYNSNNKEAIYLLNSSTNRKAVELYLNEGTDRTLEILKQLKNTLNAITLGYEVDPSDINSAGYMYMNLQEFNNANLCFDFVINRYNQGFYDEIMDQENTTTFCLIFYNKSVILSLEGKIDKALNLFEETIEISRKLKNLSIEALNLLSIDNESGKLKIVEFKKDIDLFDFVDKNMELLRNSFEI